MNVQKVKAWLLEHGRIMVAVFMILIIVGATLIWLIDGKNGQKQKKCDTQIEETEALAATQVMPETESTQILETQQEESEVTALEETESTEPEWSEEISEESEQSWDEQDQSVAEVDEEVPQEPVQAQTDWVTSLQIAQSASQLLIVSANGGTATISLHNRNEVGQWYEAISTPGFVGKEGVGQASEYREVTPSGVYGFSMAFGIQPDPGAQIAYTQVDDSDYWVDDVNSAYYNRFVSTNSVTPDWNSAEHLAGAAPAYNYVLALNYNAACVPGAGSAIFLHVSLGKSTSGCISVPENIMIYLLQNITSGCTVVIDNSENISNY